MSDKTPQDAEKAVKTAPELDEEPVDDVDEELDPFDDDVIDAEAEVVGEVDVSDDDEEINRAEILNLRDTEPIPVDHASAKYPTVSIPTGDSFRHFLAMARQYERLPEDEERALGRLALDGDIEAQKRLVVHNLKLVIAIAYAYRRTWMNLVDLLQEGTIGLLEAARRWDPEVGPRFGSYAAYWIRAYILKFLMTNSRLIHTGNTRAGRKLFWRLEKERQKLIAQGIEPSQRLLAERLDVKEEDIAEVGAHLDSREVSTDSGHRPDETSIGDRLVSPTELPDEIFERAEAEEAIGELIAAFADTLDNERDIAIWERNILSPDPESLAQLGEEFGVSRQRMAQLASRIKKNFKEFVLERIGDGPVPDWIPGDFEEVE